MLQKKFDRKAPESYLEDENDDYRDLLIGMWSLKVGQRDAEAAALSIFERKPHLLDIAYDQLPITPLMVAAGEKDSSLEAFSVILTQTTDINRQQSDNGCAVIHNLARYNRHQHLKLLIESKKGSLDLNIVDNANNTPPVSMACKYDATESLALLIDAGADIEKKDKDGKTALHLACENGALNCVDLLLRNGAKVNVRDSLGMTPIHLLVLFINGVQNQEGGKGKIPHSICLACDILSLLVQHRANLKIACNHNLTPFEFASHLKVETIFIEQLQAYEGKVPTLLQVCTRHILSSYSNSKIKDNEKIPTDLQEHLSGNYVKPFIKPN